MSELVIEPRIGSRLGTPVAARTRQFVARERFCELLISSKSLSRCDDRARGLRGLMDAETGEQFMIAETELFTTRAASACFGGRK